MKYVVRSTVIMDGFRGKEVWGWRFRDMPEKTP